MGNFSRRTVIVVWERVLLSQNLFLNETIALLNFLVVIKDWSVSARNSHLAGGMKYHDGNLIVPTPGRYYIYAQLYCRNNVRTYILLNNNRITMIQPPMKTAKAEEGIQQTIYTGVVLNLKAGDVISLAVAPWSGRSASVFIDSYHSFFGAFLI